MTPAAQAIAVPVLPKQYDFIQDDTTPDILYSGAFGAGKTRSLCLRAVRKALDPKAVVGLTRKIMTDLRRTTLETLLRPCGDLPPVLPRGTYKHVRHPQEKIVLLGGGEIIPFGCDRPEGVGSMQFSDVCIDEVAELDQEEWNQLGGRCRITYTRADGTRNVPSRAGATNPEGPMHFLFQEFFERPEPRFRRVIETATFDNFFLDPAYLYRLGQMRGTARLRYLFGKWVASEGMVYPMFDAGLHEVHDSGPWLRYVAGVDYGFRHPMVLRVHGVDGDGRSHVVASWCGSGINTDQFLAWCDLARETFSPISFVVDRSAAELVYNMQEHGLEAAAAEGEHNVMYGVDLVRNRLMPQADGRPRFTMEPGLDGSPEYYSYQLDPNALKETPQKKSDHVPDADRYAIVAIHHGLGETAALYVGGRTRDFESPHVPESEAAEAEAMLGDGLWTS